MMEVQSAQTTATNIILISIALIAAALIVVSPAWRSYSLYRGTLSASALAETRWPLILVVVSGVFLWANIAMGLFGVHIVQNVGVLALIVFGGLAVVYICCAVGWRCWRDRSWRSLWSPSTGRGPQEPGQIAYWAYASALFLLLMTICLAFGSMISAMDTALEIPFGQNIQRDFEMARWFLRGAIPTFGFSLLTMAGGGLARHSCLRNTTSQQEDGA